MKPCLKLDDFLRVSEKFNLSYLTQYSIFDDVTTDLKWTELDHDEHYELSGKCTCMFAEIQFRKQVREWEQERQDEEHNRQQPLSRPVNI